MEIFTNRNNPLLYTATQLATAIPGHRGLKGLGDNALMQCKVLEEKRNIC